MSREDQLPEEETPAVPEDDTPDAPVEDAPDEPADVPKEPASSETDSESRAIASAEDQPQDQPQETRECTMPEESTQSREKGRRPHPLWRGFWLAVCILAIAVLMGQVDAVGVAWVRQPMRAFGGAIAAGGVLASLPGLIRRDLPERPRLRRCILALFIGLIWGVLG